MKLIVGVLLTGLLASSIAQAATKIREPITSLVCSIDYRHSFRLDEGVQVYFMTDDFRSTTSLITITFEYDENSDDKLPVTVSVTDPWSDEPLTAVFSEKREVTTKGKGGTWLYGPSGVLRLFRSEFDMRTYNESNVFADRIQIYIDTGDWSFKGIATKLLFGSAMEVYELRCGDRPENSTFDFLDPSID